MLSTAFAQVVVIGLSLPPSPSLRCLIVAGTSPSLRTVHSIFPIWRIGLRSSR